MATSDRREAQTGTQAGTPKQVRPGTTIGSYELAKRIGAGGMGEVWLAKHTLLGRMAAIKLLHPMFTNREDIVTRFFNEARAATAIADPGIVQIFDFGYVDGSAFIVMELLDGETLDARVRARVLPVPDALRITRQVASSLGAAHARGIIHRDLKPENIFLVRDPEVVGGERAKILDFGIAKLNDHDGPKTHTSTVMGTPTYMSPEQCRGAGKVEQPSDVYSLGCVLFTILIGRPPFLGEGVGDLIVKHISEPAPRAATLRSDIPLAVDELIARCLEKEPGRRYATGTELARAIGELLGAPRAALALEAAHAPTLVRPAGQRVNPIATTLSGAGAMSMSELVRPRPRKPVLLGLLGLVIAGGAITAVVATWDSTTSRATPTTQPQGSAASIVMPPSAVVHASPPIDAAGASPHRFASQPPLAPDERPTKATLQVAELADAFEAWAHTHVGHRCPIASDLRAGADPWGNPWTITCTSQPSQQRVGFVSAGPDATIGTSDDVTSWSTPAASRLLAGPRWTQKKSPRHPASRPASPTTSAPAMPTTPLPAMPTMPANKPATTPTNEPATTPDDGIPRTR